MNYLIGTSLAMKITIDQSICTLISNLSGKPDIFLGSGTFKKLGPIYEVQKAECKKQCAKNRVRMPLLFLNNNNPAFCTPYFGPDFFQGLKPIHLFKTRIVGAD